MPGRQSPLQHFTRVSIIRIPHRRLEPLFIPKLQSRFADFPISRYLHTKGYMPWRPDAVISTEHVCYASTSLQGVRGYAHDELPRRITTMPLFLELGSYTGALPLGRYESPAALTSRREAVQCVAAIRHICRDLSLLPFRRVISALAYSLGPSHSQSVLVAAKSFSSSVAGTPANSYFN